MVHVSGIALKLKLLGQNMNLIDFILFPYRDMGHVKIPRYVLDEDRKIIYEFPADFKFRTYDEWIQKTTPIPSK